jgi:hypothetical protein
MHIYPALRRAVLCAALVFPGATGAVAQQPQEPPAIDQMAHDLIAATAEYLSDQETLRVNWFVSFDTVLDGREKLTELRSGSTLLSRSEGFVSSTENGMKSRDYYFDGAAFYIVDPDANSYVLAPFDGTFEDLITRVRQEYDMALPIWSVLSNRARGELLDAADSIAYVGLTRIAGRDAHHIALSDYEGDWQIWISTDPEQPELIMLVGTDPYQQGWPQYRVFFNDWDFEPAYDPADFAFTPDAEADRMTWPKAGTSDSYSATAPLQGDE